MPPKGIIPSINQSRSTGLNSLPKKGNLDGVEQKSTEPTSALPCAKPGEDNDLHLPMKISEHFTPLLTRIWTSLEGSESGRNNRWSHSYGVVSVSQTKEVWRPKGPAPAFPIADLLGDSHAKCYNLQIPSSCNRQWRMTEDVSGSLQSITLVRLHQCLSCGALSIPISGSGDTDLLRQRFVVCKAASVLDVYSYCTCQFRVLGLVRGSIKASQLERFELTSPRIRELIKGTSAVASSPPTELAWSPLNHRLLCW